MRPKIRKIDAGRLTPKDASALLGIPYETVLRYARELERKSLLKVLKEPSGKVVFTRADLEILRKHHEEDPRGAGSRFRPEADIDLHSRLLSDLRTISENLEAMADRAAALVNRLNKAPVSSTLWVKTIPLVGFKLRDAIPVTVVSDGKAFSALSAELGVEASGRNRISAVRALRERVAAEYLFLDQLKDRSPEEEERMRELDKVIVPEERGPKDNG